jgi:hypothetical protein
MKACRGSFQSLLLHAFKFTVIRQYVLLTSRFGALVEKLFVAQRLKKPHFFYKTLLFITVFTTAPPLATILIQLTPVRVVTLRCKDSL